MSMLALALLQGCGDDGTSAITPTSVHETGTVEDTGDTGTITTEPGPDVPPPDPVAMATSLEAALTLVPELSTRACFDVYADLAADSTRVCPLVVGTELGREWAMDSCTGPGGTTYSGTMVFDDDQHEYVADTLFDDWFTPYGSLVGPAWPEPGAFTGDTNGLWIDGHAAIGPPGGEIDSFLLAGRFRSLSATQDGVQLRWHGLEGTCLYDRPVGTWIDRRPTLWVHLAQLSAEGSDAYRTEVDGTIGNLPAPYASVSFQALAWTDPRLGGSCALEPTGAVELRHDDGPAYRVTFGDACDGCGRISVLGFDLGEMCADFSALARPFADTTFSSAELP